MLRVLLLLSGLALTIYALLDCAKSDESEIRGLPKLWWVVLIALVAWVGPICWLIGGRPESRAFRRTSARFRPAPRSGPVGPEDDPEFLRKLRRHTSG